MKSLYRLLCCVSFLLGTHLIVACSFVTPSPTAAPKLTTTATQFPTSTPVSPSPTAVATETPDTTEEGDSFETAVVIEASDGLEGVTAEYEWLETHYPGHRIMLQALVKHNGKIYDIFTIITAEGIEKNIYFDITSRFGKW
jgi:hypothetical protein